MGRIRASRDRIETIETAGRLALPAERRRDISI